MSKLSQKHLEIITETAVRTALEHLEKQKKEQNKKRVDRRLRNTKLLIANYKNFKLQCTENGIEIAKLEDPNDFDYLEVDDLVIESIIQSKKRTMAMVNYLDRILEVYRVVTKGKPDEERKYDTINKIYVSEEEFSIADVAKCHNVNVRTVQRDIDSAIRTLSILVFGVDSIRLID